MDETMATGGESPYPEMIRNLPEVEIPLPGIRGRLLQGERRQAVFFEIEEGTQIPPHSHCAQWGIMVEGRISLTIGGRTRVYEKGDRYFIPDGVVHSATFPTKAHVIDVFEDPARYKPKA